MAAKDFLGVGGRWVPNAKVQSNATPSLKNIDGALTRRWFLITDSALNLWNPDAEKHSEPSAPEKRPKCPEPQTL